MSLDKESRVAVLIPAYNPDKQMSSLVHEMAEKFEHIIVVNDGCSDEYTPIFEELDHLVTRINHEVNKGKGRALKTGFEYILNNLKDVTGVVTVDADGQHTVEDTMACCKKFLENPKTAVFGCRDFLSDTSIPPRSRFGNRLTSKLMKFFCDIELSDTQTGLRVLPYTSLDEMLKVEGDRYEYETNQLLKIGSDSVAYAEVPIETVYIDDNQTSHFHPLRDSARIYGVILKFAASSLISCIIDLVAFRVILAFIPTLIAEATRSTIAGTAARIISAACNFLINKKAVFSHKGDAAGSAVRYVVLALCQLGASLGLVALFTFVFGIDSDWLKTLVKAVVDTCLFFVSFKIQRNWVFKK